MLMQKLLSFFVVLSLASLSNLTLGQYGRSFCNQKIDSLNKLGIDTFIYYQTFGQVSPDGPECCVIHERSYLVWKENEELRLLIYSEYFNMDANIEGTSAPIFTAEDSLDIFTFLKSNFEAIVSRKLLPAVLRKITDSGVLITDYGRYPPSHSGYIQVEIFTKLGTYQNGFSDTDLQNGTILNVDGSFREKWESLHYASNVKHPLYQFTLKLNSLIAQFEKLVKVE